MVSERWNTVRWGSNTALNPAVRRFVETFDSSFESLDSSFESLDSSFESLDTSFESLDTSFESLDTSLDALNQTIDPSVNRFVEAVDSALVAITQS